MLPRAKNKRAATPRLAEAAAGSAHVFRSKRARHRRLGAALMAPMVATLLSLQTGCRAEQQWPLWEHYKARFLDGSGRIIDHSAEDKTTSEGQGYGMFFALVANDRRAFDTMLRWTEDNLAGGDLTARLPGWAWGKAPDGSWKLLDAHSAADSDLWIAYDCMEAGRLWNDDRLLKLGAVLADRIAHSEVRLIPGVGTVLLSGAEGFHPAPDKWILNPSYMPPEVIARVLQQAGGSSVWAGVERDLPMVLTQGASSGWAMDWLVADAGGVHPSASPAMLAQGKPETALAVGGYEAIRVYLWLGMADRTTPGVADSLNAMPSMAKYLAGAPAPPELVTSQGTVTSPDAPVGFSAAVYPYLIAVGKSDEAKAQMNRVDASLDATSGLYGHDPRYYDQNLILFATGWRDSRFRFDRSGRLRLKWRG